MIKLRASRRAVVAGGLASLASACAPRPPATFFTPSRRPIGIQLYSVAKEANADLDGTLAAIAAIGYRTVEIAGYIGKTPSDLRAALDRAGLRCTSAHVPGKPFRPTPRTLDDDPGVLAEEAQILGFKTVIMPLFVTPDRLPIVLRPGADVRKVVGGVLAQMRESDWLAVADYMNAKGAALKKVGLNFGYHNHGTEFGPAVGGTGSIIELLIARTDPGLVNFQLDCGWAVSAGVDPAAFIRKHKSRIRSLHLKDVAMTNVPNFDSRIDPAETGNGITDWPALLAAARDAGVENYFVEQEAPYIRPVLDSLRDNFRFLSTIVT